MIRSRLLLKLSWCLICLLESVASLPMEQTVPFKRMECFYDTFQEGERATMSIFVLSGSPLQATIRLEGPLAPLGADQNMQKFHESVMEFERNPNAKMTSDDFVYEQQVVDFESIEFEPLEEEEAVDQITGDDKHSEVMKVYERAKRRNEIAKRKRQAVRASDDPVLFTNGVPRAGWYRGCVVAHVDTVDVEFDLRKESDYGMHPSNDHVLSQDDYRRLQEDISSDAAQEKATAAMTKNGRRNVQQLQWQQGEMANDEDFVQAKEKIKELRSLLADIQSLMAKERRRVATHKQINEHSHQRMVKASFWETVLFVGITLMQVYLIHTWFTSGAPVLGR
ncbi:unnamed protein product [Cylindrotheca closterium]|uniref:GOLD domain-containing protein n=1 Tax=Cylindrotheca closterium TaxID=2856 RepID=A0AAD2PWA1_9STRA|nr:unnamed protein product [Cylindrotheca closterium]